MNKTQLSRPNLRRGRPFSQAIEVGGFSTSASGRQDRHGKVVEGVSWRDRARLSESRSGSQGGGKSFDTWRRRVYLTTE